MNNEECRCKFNKEREDILGRYRATVEDSLTSANFLHSTDMTVLQAFTIYIVCGRFDKQGPNINSLVPIAVDIAQKNGLTRLDSDSIISPFENEMRRRIWWQLFTLDIRNAEDHDLEPCITEPSATQKLPRSINDINIHPGMSEIPPSSSERTELLFTLDRHEISTLARRILFSEKFCQENSYPISSVSEKCNEIDRFQARIEHQILSLCNTDIPVDFITVTSSRLVLAKLKLSVIKPKTRQNQHILIGEDFRYTCVEILKSARALRLYEEGKQYLWLFQTYLEWDALAYLIINLSLVPSSHTTSSAWEAAEDIYEYWKSRSEVLFDGRWKQIESLRSQALLARRVYQDNPASMGLWLVDSGDQADSGSANAVEFQGTSPEPFIGAYSNTLEPNSDVDSDIPVPTTGTAYQWSAALFERYFQVLDSEHITEVVSWL
ncbi:hypothetical protein N7481_006842 [Penicillium waksmanii]|uniref:uncharacterized protein n=1 Tax=Penicillium waksmanii TaxID=69791 RepID=UPI00254816E0|nr:uncharacterized protein N7481_006842 [Penicillium waksmanii]KAJ5979544.1 hypothetical protein N7481_006842 [Penicillium waksmanii]